MQLDERLRKRSPVTGGLGLLLVCVVPRIALGQAAPTTPTTTPTATTPPNADASSNPDAEAMVQQGVALRRAGNDQAALESFRRAFALSPSPRIRAQMALAEQALGQWAAADVDLRAALADQADSWIQRNRSLLEEAQTTINTRLATVGVSCSQPGARLFVNDREVGTFPLQEPIRVESGSVVLEVRLDGYRTIQRPITVEAGRTFRESFTLVRTSDVNVENASGPGRLRVVRMIEEYVPNRAGVPLMVVGAVAALGGLGANIYWQNRVSLYNSSATMRMGQATVQGTCFNPTSEFPTRIDRCGAVLTESWVGFGLMVAGYVAGAGLFSTGLALRMVGGQRRMREEIQDVHPTAMLSCAPSLSATNTGVSCVGVF